MVNCRFHGQLLLWVLYVTFSPTSKPIPKERVVASTLLLKLNIWIHSFLLFTYSANPVHHTLPFPSPKCILSYFIANGKTYIQVIKFCSLFAGLMEAFKSLLKIHLLYSNHSCIIFRMWIKSCQFLSKSPLWLCSVKNKYLHIVLKGPYCLVLPNLLNSSLASSSFCCGQCLLFNSMGYFYVLSFSDRGFPYQDTTPFICFLLLYFVLFVLFFFYLLLCIFQIWA